jgi:ubiquinone/menaquinone biosynthesis C-methylase UbiE
MMQAVLQTLTRRLAKNPRWFSLIRDVVNLGGVRHVIARAVELAETDEVVDVGCGVGELCTLVRGSYYGIDYNPDYIKYASQRYGNPRRRFEVLDAKNLARLPLKGFDKAFYISMLHHFSDRDNVEILGQIGRITRQEVIVIDLVPSTNPVKKLLCSLDRGEYLRPLETQRALIERVLALTRCFVFDTRSRSATHSFFACAPRT